MAKSSSPTAPPANPSPRELQARCARAVSQIVLEAAGDLSRSTALLAILDDFIPGLYEAWIVQPFTEPIAWRDLPGRAPPELPRRGSFDEPHRFAFEIPGHTAALVLGRPDPLNRFETRCAVEVCAALATILELRVALTQRARVLKEDFDLLVEATREISRCQSLEDLYQAITREGQRLLKQKRHNLFCLQRYSTFDQELTCVAASGEETERIVGLKLTTSPDKSATVYYPRYDDGRIASDLPRQRALSSTGALLREGADYQLIADVDMLDAGEPYYCLSVRTRSEMGVPIGLADGTLWGVLNVENPHPNAFSEFFDLPLLQAYARIIAVFLHELERRDKAYTLDDIISLPDEIKRVIRLSAQSSESVLITGETGTGKELVARALHYGSPRKKYKFIPVNCGAIEPNLMMSELFGTAAHSYTGAGGRDRMGLFHAAHKGTIFLDEIENMPVAVQEALLRVVERGEIRKVGDTAVEEVDVRILAATNIDLRTKIREGTFRQDLYYRLKILEITLPPLRERREFIPVLLETFIGQLRRPMQEVRIDPALIEVLRRYDWPGNVRELKNLIKRMLVFSQDLTIDLLPEEIRRHTLPGGVDLEVGKTGGDRPHRDGSGGPALEAGPRTDGMPAAGGGSSGEGLRLDLHFDREATGVLDQLERRILQEALTLFQGDRYQVAKFLGLSPPSIYRKIKEYGIQEERRYR